MVAPLLPASLAPLTWLRADVPADRECSALPIARGEHCFAILLYRPPKRSKWRPRTVDAIPPTHRGKRQISFASRVLANVLKDAREFNERELLRLVPGKSVELWAVPVSIVCGFDETAQPVNLLHGGRTND